MTVPSETSRVAYVGNGVTTNFSTIFYFLVAADLKVRHTPVATGVETILTLGVHYTVNLPAAIGGAGSIDMVTAPAATDDLVIERDVDFTQVRSFRGLSSFEQAVHEDAFDRLVFQDQELLRRVSDLESAGAPGSVVAGDGLEFASTTLHVRAGNGIVANPNDVAVDYGGAPANVTKAAAAAGVATTVSRSDHKHDVTTAAPAAASVAIGNAAGEGASTSLARADHVHPVTAPGAPADVTKAAAAAGASANFAREDHKHDVTTAAAVELTDSTNAEGAATTLARSNHTHSHGNRGGGSLHAAAIAGGASGFMTGAQATQLADIVAGGRVRATRVAAQSLPVGDTTLVVSTEVYDTQAEYEPTTGVFTAARDGYYHVDVSVLCAAATLVVGDTLLLYLYKNSSTTPHTGAPSHAWAAVSETMGAALSCTIDLLEGDTIEVKASVVGSTALTTGAQSLNIEKLA